MKWPKKQRGFTLLEMIVALAISGLLVTLAYGSLRIGIRSWEASQTRVEQSDAMRIGWQFLQRSLIEAKAVTDPLQNTSNLLFSGTSTTLSFVADMPSHLGLGGLYVIQIAPQGNQDLQLKLSRTLLSEYKQRNTENRPQQAILVDELNHIDIAYYGQLNEKGSAGWHSTWLEQKTLPQLVRLDIKQADGKSWPTLTAHLQLGRGRGIQQNTLDQTNGAEDNL